MKPELVEHQARIILNEVIGTRAIDVKIETKRGGWSAVVYPKEQRLVIRINTWAKLGLYGRRVLIAHEALHLLGLDHKASAMYGNSIPDLASLAVYRRTWGRDELYKQAELEADSLVEEILDGARA